MVVLVGGTKFGEKGKHKKSIEIRSSIIEKVKKSESINKDIIIYHLENIFDMPEYYLKREDLFNNTSDVDEIFKDLISYQAQKR